MKRLQSKNIKPAPTADWLDTLPIKQPIFTTNKLIRYSYIVTKLEWVTNKSYINKSTHQPLSLSSVLRPLYLVRISQFSAIKEPVAIEELPAKHTPSFQGSFLPNH